jgi:hypothetical protein
MALRTNNHAEKQQLDYKYPFGKRNRHVMAFKVIVGRQSCRKAMEKCNYFFDLQKNNCILNNFYMYRNSLVNNSGFLANNILNILLI